MHVTSTTSLFLRTSIPSPIELQSKFKELLLLLCSGTTRNNKKQNSHSTQETFSVSEASAIFSPLFSKSSPVPAFQTLDRSILPHFTDGYRLPLWLQNSSSYHSNEYFIYQKTSQCNLRNTIVEILELENVFSTHFIRFSTFPECKQVSVLVALSKWIWTNEISKVQVIETHPFGWVIGARSRGWKNERICK